MDINQRIKKTIYTKLEVMKNEIKEIKEVLINIEKDIEHSIQKRTLHRLRKLAVQKYEMEFKIFGLQRRLDLFKLENGIIEDEKQKLNNI